MIPPPAPPAGVQLEAVELDQLAEAVSNPMGARITPVLSEAAATLLSTSTPVFRYFARLVEYHGQEQYGGVALTLRPLHPTLVAGEPPANAVLFVVCPSGTPEGMVSRSRLPEHGYWQPYAQPLEGGQAVPLAFADQEIINLRQLRMAAEPHLVRAAEGGMQLRDQLLAAVKRWLERNRNEWAQIDEGQEESYGIAMALNLLVNGGDLTFDTFCQICYLAGLDPANVLMSAKRATNEGSPQPE